MKTILQDMDLNNPVLAPGLRFGVRLGVRVRIRVRVREYGFGYG